MPAEERSDGILGAAGGTGLAGHGRPSLGSPGMEQQRRPGLTEALIVWALFAAVAVAVVVTYSRLTPEALYHTSGSGIEAGASRVLVFLGYPFSIAAIALAAIGAARLATRSAALAAAVAAALCATIGFPGVIDQADLDARPVNALAGAGVAIAFGLALVSLVREGVGPTRPFGQADLLRALAAVALLLVGLPWVFAELGFYVSDVPVLGRIFLAKEVVLSRVPRQLALAWQVVALSSYLALMLVYGLANALQDFWTEQLVKRGTVSVKIPSLIRPDASSAWAAMVGATLLICLAVFRVGRVDPRQRGGTS